MLHAANHGLTAFSVSTQKPEVPAALATVAEEEELREGGPAVGRLPLVTESSLADVPRHTATAFSTLFDYGMAARSLVPLSSAHTRCSKSKRLEQSWHAQVCP